MIFKIEKSLNAHFQEFQKYIGVVSVVMVRLGWVTVGGIGDFWPTLSNIFPPPGPL